MLYFNLNQAINRVGNLQHQIVHREFIRFDHNISVLVGMLQTVQLNLEFVPAPTQFFSLKREFIRHFQIN